MSEWARTQKIQNGVAAKCDVIESKLNTISRVVRDGGVNGSKWIDEAHAEALSVLSDMRDILEFLAMEQSARLAEYEENCSVASHVRKVLYREDAERSEVDNE